jgi:hypothetical protein
MLKSLNTLMALTVLAATLGLVLGGVQLEAIASPQPGDRDKTGTTWGPANGVAAEIVMVKPFAAAFSFRAEGMGIEPTTPCGAPHFQCGR